MAENDRRGVMRRAVEACIAGDTAVLPEVFTGDKISVFRNYFDNASLLEQMLVA